MGFLKKMATGFVWVCTFLAAITFIPGLPPNVDFSPYVFTLPKAVSNVNYKLGEAEILFRGQVKGPEAFDAYDGVLYTTVHGGAVSKYVGKELVEVVRFGQKCDGLWEEEKCGRPLGLKFDKHGRLYVVDTYYGIFKVDVKTGKYEKVIDINQPINGKVPMAPNSIDIAKNGDLYWTDSSTEYKIYDGILTMLSDPNGRLIRYNAATKKNEVLLDNLGFANGVKLSDDESFVIVAESMLSRVIKYYLKGSKADKSEIFIEGLPGIPDNIHTDGQGNYLISLIVSADEEHPQLSQSLAPHSNIRKMLVRLLTLIEVPFKFLEQSYPNYYSKRVIHWIGHLECIMTITPSNAAVMRIDQNGKILNTLTTTADDALAGISSAFVLGDYLWLGSPFNNYLARVPLDIVLPELKGAKTQHKVKQASTTAQKPDVKPAEIPKPMTTTTPKPKPTTTTTPKPTTTSTTPKPSTTTQKPTTTTPKPTTTTPKPKTTTSKPTTSKPVEQKPKVQAKAKVEPVKKPVVKPVREEVDEDMPKKKTFRDEI